MYSVSLSKRVAVLLLFFAIVPHVGYGLESAACQHYVKQCYVCSAKPEKLPRCSACHSIKYCSSACQAKDWPRHKKECELLLSQRLSVCAHCKKNASQEHELKVCPCGAIAYCDQNCQSKHWLKHKKSCKAKPEELPKMVGSHDSGIRTLLVSRDTLTKNARDVFKETGRSVRLDDKQLAAWLDYCDYVSILRHLHAVGNREVVKNWLKNYAWGHAPLMFDYGLELVFENVDLENAFIWTSGAHYYFDLDCSCVEKMEDIEELSEVFNLFVMKSVNAITDFTSKKMRCNQELAQKILTTEDFVSPEWLAPFATLHEESSFEKLRIASRMGFINFYNKQVINYNNFAKLEEGKFSKIELCMACCSAAFEGIFKACGRCKDVVYCSEECQKDDWGHHKNRCDKLYEKRIFDHIMSCTVKQCKLCEEYKKQYAQLTKKHCAHCSVSESDVSKHLVCSQCKCIYYCSTKCQHADWKKHKLSCKK